MLPAICMAEEIDTGLPSIDNGKILYQDNCSACHGIKGDANTTMASTLTNPPRSFSDPKVQETLTPIFAFVTMAEGRVKSGMPSFQHLTERQRWDIAAYLFTLQSNLTPINDPRPELTWEESKEKSNLEIKELFRKRGVPEDEIMTQLSLIRFYPQ